MAYEHSLQTLSGVAAADLSALQFCFVLIDINGKIAQNTTRGGHVAGILQNKPTAGQTAEVAFAGVSRVKLGATVTPDDLIMSTDAGAANVAVGAAAPGNFVAGYALEGGASGEIGTMVLGQTGYLLA
jgi:hypothetical protein